MKGHMTFEFSVEETELWQNDPPEFSRYLMLEAGDLYRAFIRAAEKGVTIGELEEDGTSSLSLSQRPAFDVEGNNK